MSDYKKKGQRARDKQEHQVFERIHLRGAQIGPNGRNKGGGNGSRKKK